MNNGIFFCDIRGTITNDNNISETERKKNLQELVTNLSIITKNDKLDQLEFCLVSSDDVNYVKKQMMEILPYLEYEEIKLGTCYCGEKAIDPKGNVTDTFKTKEEQIRSVLNSRDDITNVFFADDSQLGTKILQNSIEKRFPDINAEFFIPDCGIEGLNMLLEDYIENKKKTI